ncbi:MAG: hypothetical protein RLY86_3250 [Pseudomonadota bacterium]|jgi:hypothetical protein
MPTAAMRMEGAKRAEALGMSLRAAATAKENLRKWVPTSAEVVVDAESMRLKPPS